MFAQSYNIGTLSCKNYFSIIYYNIYISTLLWKTGGPLKTFQKAMLAH